MNNPLFIFFASCYRINFDPSHFLEEKSRKKIKIMGLILNDINETYQIDIFN